MAVKARDVLIEKDNFVTYNHFCKSVKLTGKLKLAKSEKKILKEFYLRATSFITTGADIMVLEGELNSLVDSINVEEARKRWQEWRQKRKAAKLKKRKARKPSLKVSLSADDILESRRSTPRIGLGLESQLNIPKVNAKDVVVDQHTHSEKIKDKHILYAAGWSLEGAFAK
ncbi:hypothetical protein [Vibrio crassostreae]|uniref:hypothetical protein n=1 Tax=Vibrio crassostreae TaxID=246167 RepID=UPI000F4F5B47|nr:hypothetical protein [Vibrio crassostreae]RPF57295.1 hypothetical protein EDB61_105197 [Vibrio crassostreae]